MSVSADTSQTALTERQRRFAEFYAVSGNGADAARRAGYARSGANVRGSEILANSNVVALIDQLRKERLSALGVRADRVLEELAASAFVDPRDVFDEDGNLLSIRRMPHRVRRAIRKIKVREHYCKKTGEMTGRDVEVEFNDKLRANEILGRHLGILKEQPIQVNQQNVFAAIVARAQGNSLMPITQRDDDDSANEMDESPVIEGELVEREDAPANMASDNAIAAFNSIDEGEEDEGGREHVAEVLTRADEAPQEDEALKRKDDFTLWRGRRRRNI